MGGLRCPTEAHSQPGISTLAFSLWRTWAVLNGGVVLQPSKPSTRNVCDWPSIIPLLARRRLVEMAIGTVSTSGGLRALLGECPFSGGRLSDRNTLTDAFAGFVRETGPGLKHALMAALGAEVGMEAAAEAMAYGWEHWDRVGRMENPGGYLYRVGRNWGRRRLRTAKPGLFFPAVTEEMPWVEPGLPGALARLSERQRTAVVLVHGAGWSLAEVAVLMGVSRGAVHKHVERALASLGESLEVDGED